LHGHFEGTFHIEGTSRSLLYIYRSLKEDQELSKNPLSTGIGGI